MRCTMRAVSGNIASATWNSSHFAPQAEVMVPLSFAGHDFLAEPQGALWWAAERALLVADLHLEKASWFAKRDRKSTRLNSSHANISYAVFCLKKKKKKSCTTRK